MANKKIIRVHTVKLVRPSINYRKSFIEAEEEFRKDKIKVVPDYAEYPELYRNFKFFVKKIRGRAQGKYLPPGFVPDSIYWLVKGKKYMGSLSIRHKLTPHLRKIGGHIGYKIRPSERRKGYGTEILFLGLQKARKLGIEKVLITCDFNNTASKKIIEQNGGRFEARYKQKLRYWI